LDWRAVEGEVVELESRRGRSGRTGGPSWGKTVELGSRLGEKRLNWITVEGRSG
jgi:hypothetical protein